jgi:Family of unknown function (DUF6328)
LLGWTQPHEPAAAIFTKPVSTSLEKKVQDALNESRILVLGVQVLLSFQYTSVLENAFVKLPFISQALELVTLALLLLTFGLLVSPVPYHLLVWRSEDSEDVQTFVSTIVEIALLPFAIALSIDVYISVQPVTDKLIAIVIGAAIFMTAVFFWYVLEAARVRHDENPSRAHERGTPMPKHIRATTSTEEKIQHALTEARVVLPGAQALLGFQFVAVLLGGFETLPASSRYLHVASLTLVTLSTILLMTPAAYHRIVEKGEATEHFFRVASAMVLWSLIPLSCGTCGDFFILARKVSGSMLLASAATGVILVCFYGWWFGLSLYRREARGALQN